MFQQACKPQCYATGDHNILLAKLTCFRDGEELRSYVIGQRKVLAAVASFCQTQLAAVGVDGHIGKAGYYFMPDFEVIRPMLAAR